MHGLVNCAVQGFVKDSYGTDTWIEVTRKADLEFTEFESMLFYDDALTPLILDAAADVLGRTRYEVMEDIGTYLVSNKNVESIPRLLRFGGVDFIEFLHSLEELPDRARLAVSDLRLPKMTVRDHNMRQFSLTCESPVDGWGFVMIGMLRALADDYGALVLMEHTGSGAGIETVTIDLIETEFAAGRKFELGVREG